MGISYGSLPASLKNTSTSLLKSLIDSGVVDSSKTSLLNSVSGNTAKTKVTLFDYDGTFHNIKVDYNTLPQSMRSFNKIAVVGGSRLSDTYGALLEKRVKEGKDNLNSHNAAGTNGSFYPYPDNTNLYLFQDDTLVGYGTFTEKVITGTVEVEFKEYKGFQFNVVKVNESGVSFKENKLFIDRSKLPDSLKSFSKILIHNLKLRDDTPVKTNVDIASQLEIIKGSDELNIFDYFLDSSSECLGYYYLTPDEVTHINSGIAQ